MFHLSLKQIFATAYLSRKQIISSRYQDHISTVFSLKQKVYTRAALPESWMAAQLKQKTCAASPSTVADLPKSPPKCRSDNCCPLHQLPHTYRHHHALSTWNSSILEWYRCRGRRKDQKLLTMATPHTSSLPPHQHTTQGQVSPHPANR